jgi:hypothetical protein
MERIIQLNNISIKMESIVEKLNNTHEIMISSIEKVEKEKEKENEEMEVKIINSLYYTKLK